MRRCSSAWLLRALCLAWAVLGGVACNTVRTPIAHTTKSEKNAPAPPSSQPATSTEEEEDEYATATAYDPWEKFNRAMFKFNDGLYTVLLRPIARVYETLFPEPARRGISNAFANAGYPVRFVNATLQGKFERAGKETGMFLVNTVGGVGGLFRVSNHLPELADVPAEDTGQTLATWGIPSGPYLVLPVWGPSTLRDGFGEAADYALNPVNWGLFWSNAPSWTDIPPTVNSVQVLPGRLEAYDLATANAVDPYLSLRSSYLQNRAHEAAR